MPHVSKMDHIQNVDQQVVELKFCLRVKISKSLNSEKPIASLMELTGQMLLFKTTKHFFATHQIGERILMMTLKICSTMFQFLLMVRTIRKITLLSTIMMTLELRK